MAASDVGEETLARLEAAVDDLATAYATTPPAELSATTLAWAGDPAAEGYARALIRQLEGPGNGRPDHAGWLRPDLISSRPGPRRR